MIDFLTVVSYVAVFALGLFCGPLSIALFKKIPTKSFCDYDEIPTDQMLDKLDKIKQVKPFSKKGMLFGVLFGAIYSLLFLQYGFSLAFLTTCLAVLPMFLLSASDAKFYIIPDRLVLCLCVPLLINLFQTFALSDKVFYSDWYSPLLGGVVGGGFLALADFAGKLIYKKEAIGGGDMKLCFAIGLILGLKLTVVLLFIMLFIAGFYCVTMLIIKKLEKSQYLPLGPFICLAFAIVCCFKTQLTMIVDTYFLLPY